MIRINLLPREERSRRRAAVPTLALPRLSLREGLAVPLLGALLIVEVLGLGGWWYWKYREAQGVLADIRILEAEDKKLGEQLKDQAVIEAARRDITYRLEVISRVAKTQGLPVTMLRGVLRSVPEGLWLTAFDVKPVEAKVKVERRPATAKGVIERLEERQQAERQQAQQPTKKKEEKPELIEVNELRGFAIVLKGSAFSILQVADFIDNLSRLGVFSEVDFLTTQQGLVEQTKVMNFEVTANVRL